MTLCFWIWPPPASPDDAKTACLASIQSSQPEQGRDAFLIAHCSHRSLLFSSDEIPMCKMKQGRTQCMRAEWMHTTSYAEALPAAASFQLFQSKEGMKILYSFSHSFVPLTWQARCAIAKIQKKVQCIIIGEVREWGVENRQKSFYRLSYLTMTFIVFSKPFHHK